MRLSVALGLCCLCSFAFSSDPASAAIRTDIPAEDLGSALQTLAQTHHVQLVYLSEKIDALKTSGAVGDLTTDEALKRLLSGTGLQYKYLDANTVTITSRDVSQATEPPRSDSRTKSDASSSSSTGGGKKSSQDFRVAQVDQTSAGTQAVDDKPSVEKKKKEDALSEIIVTGTRIRGAGNVTSPVIELGRTTIDRSGYLNTGDFLQSLPQAFAGGAQGASPDGNIGPGQNAGNNNEHATAVNLLGLGENATLTLLNGHRIAPSAFGNVVDISTIPLAAIDHIDVLTDGASAIYGADAVAGVVNIILRKGYDGADTRVSYGGSRGLRDEVVSQTFGRAWETGSLMASFEYDHGGTLPTSDRAFTAGAPEPTNIINPYTEKSLVINGTQNIGNQIRVYGDALATWKDTSNVLTRAPGETFSAFSNLHALNLNLGIGYALSDKWLIDLGGTYARQETDTGFNAYPIPLTLGQHVTYYTATIRSADLTVNGTVFSLPGGDVKVAIGATQRNEDARNEITDPNLGNSDSVYQDVTAEYAELHVPLVGPANASALAKTLFFSAAIRHDKYSQFGSTTNPKFGLLWAPISSFDLRVNWSKSFRPPSPGELISAANGSFIFNDAWASPSGVGTVPVLIAQGNSPTLGPETARNINIGMDFKPVSLPGLELALDYYDIDFRNRIIAAPYDAEALLHPDVYGSLITPLASDAAANALVASYVAQGAQYFDVLGTGTTGVRYFYNAELLNAAVVRQNGFNFVGKYTFSLGAESFQTNANVAFVNKIDTQFSPTAISTNLVNTYSHPLRWKARWDGTWVHGFFDLTGAVNWSGDYTDTTAIPYAPVSSWTTFDLSAAYSIPVQQKAFGLGGFSVRFSVINLFDRAPPYVSGNGAGLIGVHYDVGNASPLGRSLSIQLRKQW